MVILNLYGIPVHAVVVFRPEHDFMLKSACDFTIDSLEASVILNMHQIFVSSILVTSSTVQTDFFFSQVQKVPSRANQLPDNSWQNFGIIQKRQFVMPLKNCGGSPCATLCRKISILEFHISFSELFFRSLVFHNGFMIF